MLHQIKTTQLLKTNLDTAWEFISNPQNLALITPPSLAFKILNEKEIQPMYAGQIIEYHVRPALNIKMHWVTEITHVKEKHFFIDEQRFGPYAFWHHQHILLNTNEGVLMKDIIHYKLPLGPLGKLANHLFVKNQLRAIFLYREKKLNELFDQKKL